jgi:ribosomal protein S18 acetylase RimI-like enzyme
MDHADTRPPIVIRHATMADHPAIRDLLHQSDLLHAQHLPHTARAPDEPRFSTGYLRSLLSGGQAAVLVAVDAGPIGPGDRGDQSGDEVVGFAILEEEHPSGPDEAPGPWCAVYDLAVRHDYWGRGVGTSLMAAAEAWARARGLGQLRLDVYEFNDRARTLYERLGYTTHSRELLKVIEPSGDAPAGGGTH